MLVDFFSCYRLLQILVGTAQASSMTCEQFNPEEGSAMDEQLRALNSAFTMVFAMELIINIFVNWFKTFISNGVLTDFRLTSLKE